MQEMGTHSSNIFAQKGRAGVGGGGGGGRRKVGKQLRAVSSLLEVFIMFETFPRLLAFYSHETMITDIY